MISVAALVTTVHAESCEDRYGTCLVNKRFKIEKKVRIGDSGDWKSKVTGVDKDEMIEFHVKITNMSDNEGNIDFDNMKMTDKLPDELTRTGGDGLTEYWDNFKPGETKSFTIKAKVNSDEYDRQENFEKCVVNKASVRWGEEFEGSDTATVCYSNSEPKELPKTGHESIMAIAGLGLVVSGLLISKKTSKARA